MSTVSPKLTRETKEQKAPLDLRKALAANPTLEAKWNNLTPISRRDFVSWIEGAKQPETRARRIAITCDKLASGKRRPCCYAVVPMNLYSALNKTPKAKAIWKDLTPIERRDFVEWIHEIKNKEELRLRIEKVCLMLASKKRSPYLL